MAELYNYDPSKVFVIVGPTPITGFADGTFVSIDEMSDGVTSQSGADGEVVRAISTDRRVEIKITLQQTSLGNAALSALYIADKVSGASVFPVAIEDMLGGSVFFSGQAWVNKRATTVYSKGIENREWTITAVVSSWSALQLGRAL